MWLGCNATGSPVVGAGACLRLSVTQDRSDSWRDGVLRTSLSGLLNFEPDHFDLPQYFLSLEHRTEAQELAYEPMIMLVTSWTW